MARVKASKYLNWQRHMSKRRHYVRPLLSRNVNKVLPYTPLRNIKRPKHSETPKADPAETKQVKAMAICESNWRLR